MSLGLAEPYEESIYGFPNLGSAQLDIVAISSTKMHKYHGKKTQFQLDLIVILNKVNERQKPKNREHEYRVMLSSQG